MSMKHTFIASSGVLSQYIVINHRYAHF